MGEINISLEEKSALNSVDIDSLRRSLDQCLREGQRHPLVSMRLNSCGDFVSCKLRDFGVALEEYSKAKSSKKRSDTLSRVTRASWDLVNAVEQMQHRIKREEEEAQRFYIDDRILPPHQLDQNLSVRVDFCWRASAGDSWNHGNITFLYDVDLRPSYRLGVPGSKRKPSASKQKQEIQEKLFDEWDHLKRLALYAVRDYFRDGRDGAGIPRTFRINVDAYSHGLNNFSTKFWV